MTGTAFNLLTDPLIEVDIGTGERQWTSLPKVLELLGDDHEIEFPDLQAHHRHPWHAFMVQLAGLALIRARKDSPRQSADDWRRWLQILAPAPAWCLVNSNFQEPAFLQPPVPENHLAKLKNKTPFPDQLDILVTAKNHEVKAHTIDLSAPLDLARKALPQLITYQTFSGFGGRALYGVSRMNGGFSSRSCVAFYHSHSWNHRFSKDLLRLLEHRDSVLEDFDYLEDEEHALLWLLPWGGKADEVLSIAELDPFFIEICRRVRLTLEENQLIIHQGSSQAARVDAKELKGNLGDLWTPIRRKDLAALTVSDRGFNYRLITQLLLEDDVFEPAPAQTLGVRSQDTIAFFSALVRGQGKTGGFHERSVPIPVAVVDRLTDARKQEIGSVARKRIEIASETRIKVLKLSLLALAQGGIEWKKLDFTDDSGNPWLNTFDSEVDRVFFDRLFAEVDLPPEERDARWQTQLKQFAQKTFRDAAQVLPRRDALRIAAEIDAEFLFNLKIKEILPFAGLVGKAKPKSFEEGKG